MKTSFYLTKMIRKNINTNSKKKYNNKYIDLFDDFWEDFYIISVVLQDCEPFVRVFVPKINKECGFNYYKSSCLWMYHSSTKQERGILTNKSSILLTIKIKTYNSFFSNGKSSLNLLDLLNCNIEQTLLIKEIAIVYFNKDIFCILFKFL